jgi:DNA polymerase V
MGGKTSGFASPAQGYEVENIDLNSLLIRNHSATYFFRLDSGEMAELGLQKGALLVVDRSKNPKINEFVLIRHEGQFLCRMLAKHGGSSVFTNGKTKIKPIVDDTEIIGVVTASIKEYDSTR